MGSEVFFVYTPVKDIKSVFVPLPLSISLHIYNHSGLKHIAIFASGGGSNAAKIIEYFKQSPEISVKLIVCNKPHAGVLAKAETYGVDTLMIDRHSFYEGQSILDELDKCDIDLIVLAGFLWLVPEYLVHAYDQRIVNIHPALLPNYGGKGMYGHHVHKAVKAAGDKQSGMTIHYVSGAYDEGSIILQRRCALHPDDTPEDIAKKVLKLEHRYYPIVIEDLLGGI